LLLFVVCLSCTLKADEGIPSYTIIENAAWDHILLTGPMKEIAKKADAVCFGTLAQRSEESRNTIQAFLSLTPPHAYRILDINIRQHYYSEEIIASSLEKSNVLKMNEEELKLLKRLFSWVLYNLGELCEL